MPFPLADVTLRSLAGEFIAVNTTDYMLSPENSLPESLNLGVVWRTPTQQTVPTALMRGQGKKKKTNR